MILRIKSPAFLSTGTNPTFSEKKNYASSNKYQLPIKSTRLMKLSTVRKKNNINELRVFALLRFTIEKKIIYYRIHYVIKSH